MFGIKKKEQVIKNPEEQKVESKKINKAEYKVIIKDKIGGVARTIKEIKAYRWKDELDEVVYLKNDDERFIEIFPEQINDFKNYKETEVDALIKKYQKILEAERDRDTEDINEKDIEFELLKLQAKKRSFKFNHNSSYLDLDQNNQPTFTFLRQGSDFLPFKWDLDSKTIFVPSDNRKKSASLALRNKESKYNTKKLLDGISIVLVVIGFLMLGAGGYMIFKANNTAQEAFANYETSELAVLQRQCLEATAEQAKLIQEAANNVNDITESIDENLNRPQTIIQGVLPE